MNPQHQVVEDNQFGGRIRVKDSCVEVFSIPGGQVHLRDGSGKVLAKFGVSPYQTRVLSLKGMGRGRYTVDLSSLTGGISATVDA
ncbi:MAG TPA: hypothetical protein PKO15_17315 [Fibrobacteria bacterium]|nr:hypothetical protein [Fibrobacteria bacterium]HOX51874.1 hypothetical protein [Fibrobacteria bacterium]